MTNDKVLRALLGALWLAVIGPAGLLAQESADKPFFNAREQQRSFAGPGRDSAEPEYLTEIRIGYFGPNDPSHSLAGDMWRAARLAIHEANANGGYQKRPFRLVPAWSHDPWGTGIKQLTRLVYADNVWAIVGGIDGPSTHLAEQVVAKARLALVSPVSTDKSVNLAHVPWMFSLAPPDNLQAPMLADEIAQRVGKGRFVVLSADDHDSHCFARELDKALSDRGMSARFHYEFHHGNPDTKSLVHRVAQANAASIILAADVDDSARLVVALRHHAFPGPVFGRPVMAHRRFALQAGLAAEGVVFPMLYQVPDPLDEFARKFAATYGHAPDYSAPHAYDAVRLVVAAIRTSGLNRAKLRDALVELSPWQGASGTVRWDGLGSNTRHVTLGTILQGRVIPLQPSS
ncbi:MAG: ABC transporter substrate-binding protein [Pirellulaceae bacterium]